MISLLEKEARDPVEVLRVKLKDSTDTSLLNSQLLQEIKHDYVVKQDSTKGQLDAFVQAHVDEIERASALLDVGDSVTQIVRNLDALGQSCRKMNDELGDKKLLSGISIARRNLKELEHQIMFYDDMPAKLQELHQLMDTRGDVVTAYVKWQAFDDWRQTMLQELKRSSIDKSDELGNSKAQARILASMATRLDAIESVIARIHTEVFGCLHHCVDVAQRNKPRLADAFHVLELMETRRRKLITSKHAYLDHSLQAVTTVQTPIPERCKSEIVTYLTTRATEMFRFAEREAGQSTSPQSLDGVLSAANHLLLDLESVQTDVVACFPPDIDVLQLFLTTYNTVLELEIPKLGMRPDIRTAQRLQLVQWIEYYNSDVIKYKRARASSVLDATSQTLMRAYLDQIVSQIHTWVTNIWTRADADASDESDRELASTRPNDIVNILKAQISIAQEWLTGRLVGRVVVACLDALMSQLTTRFERLAVATTSDVVDVERLCAFINDTDVLQSKCPELVEEISFAERDADEKEAFDIFMGDGLDTTSTAIVKLGVATAEAIVHQIFREVEPDTSRLWFSKKWDDNESVVEPLLATLEDYYTDLAHWLTSAFFFAKIVRLCLDACATEYAKRVLLRTHCIPNAVATAALVDRDLKHFVAFFSRYAAELRRAGVRSLDDIQRAFGAIEAIRDALLASQSQVSSDVNDNASSSSQYSDVVAQVAKLVRSSSTQEAKTSDDKSSKSDKTKATTKKQSKLKAFTAAKTDKKTDKKADKKAAKAAAKAAKAAAANDAKASSTRTSSFPDASAAAGDADDSDFTVQKLNMSDFLSA